MAFLKLWQVCKAFPQEDQRSRMRRKAEELQKERYRDLRLEVAPNNAAERGENAGHYIELLGRFHTVLGEE